MDTKQKKSERKERYWEGVKSSENKDQKEKAPSKKSKNTKSKVKLITPSRGKAGKK